MSRHHFTGERGIAPELVEMSMPNHAANQASERVPVRLTTTFGLSAAERASIRPLIGHTLALIEREFILQTLKVSRGNRTLTANVLGISIRSLRDRIRNYRDQGESVAEPESGSSDHLTRPRIPHSRH
jgi:DNA-binding NtrC family response regulator